MTPASPFARHAFAGMFVAALLGSTDGLLAQRVQDTVLTTNGRRYRGVEVTAMTSSEVVFQQSGGELKLPASSIAEINWSEPPEAYALGRAAGANGNYADAANYYAEAARNTSRDVLRAECEYFAAENLVRSTVGDSLKAAEAAAQVQSWIDANADHYRVPSARLWLGRAQVAAKNSEAATATLESLSADVLSNNWPAIWSARAKLELAQAQMAAGRHQAARTTFRGAISSARSAAGGNSADAAEMLALEAEANVGVGDSMVEEGNFKEALSYFRDLASQADNDAIRAAARAGEGQALFMEAGTDPVKLRDAQIALAKANLLDITGGDTTAKALYFSGQVILALGPDNEGPNFKQRAMDYFQSVLRTFPSSRFAGLAAQQISK